MVRLAAGRLHYAWVVFGVTFVTLLAASGMRSTPGVLIVPLEHEFQWSRAAIAAAVTINLVLFGVFGPFAAALMDRFGIRRVVAAALTLISAGAALTVFMRSLWQMYLLWGVVVGTGAGAMATVLAATVANRWFAARRGLVVGILTAAGATGQLVFLPLLAALATGPGWRWASLAFAAATAAMVPVVLLLVRDRPEDVGLSRYGARGREVIPRPAGNPARNAIDALVFAARRPAFWLLGGSFMICGASTNGLIGTHLIPASVDHGMSEVTAASLLAVIGVFDIAGTTVSGWLTDRVDPRWLLFWYYTLRGASLLVLPFVLGSSLLGLLVFIVFYGLDWVATVPPTVALSASSFGPARAGIVYGWIFTCHQVGAGIAAYGAGVARTWFGDYQLAFISAGILCVFAAGLVLRIERPPRNAVVQPVRVSSSAA